MDGIPDRTGTTARGRGAEVASITFRLVGFLFLVELASGVLQGFYVPLVPDLVDHLGLADADFNWFEAAQLLFSAVVVPVLAKLGDTVGHKTILLVSTAITAAASWALVVAPDPVTFGIAWALQGAYVVWLPLEVALIFDRGRRSGTAASATRRAAGYLVVALEAGAIVGALASGRVFHALGDQIVPTLAAPAIVVTLVFPAVLFGVPASRPVPGRRLDTAGFVLLALSLLTITSGLTFLRINGPDTWWVYALVAAGLALLVPFARHELRTPDPAIDLRVLAQPTMWPVQLTAGLIGISLLGLEAGEISNVIGAYLVSMIVGALLFPLVSSRATPRVALVAAAGCVAVGYLLFLPFHDTVAQVVTNMVVAGIGSGALVGAMPAAAAAAAAPVGQTGVATALTNTTKTIGGSFASAIFAVVLATTAAEVVSVGASSLGGYLTVFAVCGGGAVAAVVALLVVPRLAFADADVVAEPQASGAPPSI
jgi:MFS family permease